MMSYQFQFYSLVDVGTFSQQLSLQVILHNILKVLHGHSIFLLALKIFNSFLESGILVNIDWSFPFLLLWQLRRVINLSLSGNLIPFTKTQIAICVEIRSDD